MNLPMIDAHVHLDMYAAEPLATMVAESNSSGLLGWITVSRHLASCRKTLELHQANPSLIHPAYGYHPEQELPSAAELEELLNWIAQHRDTMIAVGEVGLPYYLKQEKKALGFTLDLSPYLILLEKFVKLASDYDLPIILHAVYEDADIVCDLLERYSIPRAHFHWFKGSEAAISRMIAKGYYISITPDIVYESEIQELALRYPMELMMIETDGPWPFEGPFTGSLTVPSMMEHTLLVLARLKETTPHHAAQILLENTRRFYRFSEK
jgi:TatD DNase family protein